MRPPRRLALAAGALALGLAFLAAAGELGRERSPGFTVDWDPWTGRGRVTQVLPSGDVYSICLQCGYEGYAGGLWVGSLNGSGFGWLPATPIPGFPLINLFCAQDESLVDEATGREYDPGWSQNFGRGDDGARLEYVGGAVLADGRDGGDVVLRSVNRADCFEVTRHLLWPRGAAYVVISSRVRNVCPQALTFSLWTGEDPWIGTYRSSDGDVGWHAGGLVRTERALDGRAFRWGGMIDLGNELLGQSAAPFSNAADFLLPDPALPPPDRAFFANRFAHEAGDVDPARPLDNRSLTAFNLGWVGRRLAPGEAAVFRYALGHARSGPPGSVPGVPDIPPAHWAFAAADLDPADGLHAAPATGVRFREEDILVTVDPPLLRVEGLYVFENATDTPRQSTMFYPLPIDEWHLPPEDVAVRGVAAWEPRPAGLSWRVDVPARGTATVAVRYAQRCLVPDGRYVLTSTQRWGAPLDRARYEVRWTAAADPLRATLPGVPAVREGVSTLRWEGRAVLPLHDLVIQWPGAGRSR